MSTLLILNAKIVNENSIIESDIYIRNGRIEKIAANLSAMKVLHVLDVKGKYVLPGMIDDNVKFHQPNKSKKVNLGIESQAAIAGGITTFFDMPSSYPETLNFQLLEEKMKLANETSIANYSFYLGASKDNIELIKTLEPNANCGIKVCLGDAFGKMLVDDPETLDELFKHSPTLIAAHCEDMPNVIENEENYRQIYDDEIPLILHPKIRSEAACYKASSLAVELAKEHDTRLHILQISSAKEVDLFSNSALDEKRITAEVCYPYLDFSDENYTEENSTAVNKDQLVTSECKGGLIKCNPSIKSEIDRAVIFQGLMDDHLDTIGTSHTPFTLDHKQGNYFQIVSGMPLVQEAMPSLLEHYHDGIFSLEFIAQKTSHAVAELFNIKDRGYIREGYWADLVVLDVDLQEPIIAANENVISSSGWTPYAGDEFRSSVYATIVNGNLVYINNKVRTGERGMRVEFDREK